jgi:hypothetical protein
MARYEAGNQTCYVYTFNDPSLSNILQYCRSYAEAESWAQTYRSMGLASWGERNTVSR